jgi:hypothetical protein
MPRNNAAAAAPKVPPFAKETLEALDGKLTGLSDDAQILFAAPLGRDVAIVSISSYQGKVGLDVRRFYLSDDDKWMPTAKGIRLPLASAPSLAAALTAYVETVGA